MLLMTEEPTAAERAQVLAAMPWFPDFLRLWQAASAAFDHHSVNGVDAAIPLGHARAAVVALFEGIESMLDAVHELSDSRALMLLLDRTEVPRPTLRAPLSADGTPSSYPLTLCLRLARSSLENAAIRAASAADHLANAHVRLAWELNAATTAEVRDCDFDSRTQQPVRWLSAPFLAGKLADLPGGDGARLPFFTANEVFAAFHAAPAGASVRRYRDRIVHRERPAYQELPSLGRATRWRGGRLTFAYEPDPGTPTFAQQQDEVGAALQALLPWAQSLWSTAVRWLSTMGVEIGENGSGGVSVKIARGSKPTRGQRDPALYLLDYAPFAPT